VLKICYDQVCHSSSQQVDQSAIWLTTELYVGELSGMHHHTVSEPDLESRPRPRTWHPRPRPRT